MMEDQKMAVGWLGDTYWVVVVVDAGDEECGMPRERNAVFMGDACARSNSWRIKQLWLGDNEDK